MAQWGLDLEEGTGNYIFKSGMPHLFFIYFFKVNIPRNCSEMTMDRQETLLEGLHDLRQIIGRILLLRYCSYKSI